MNLIPTEGHRKLLKNRIGHVVALVEAQLAEITLILGQIAGPEDPISEVEEAAVVGAAARKPRGMVSAMMARRVEELVEEAALQVGIGVIHQSCNAGKDIVEDDDFVGHAEEEQSQSARGDGQEDVNRVEVRSAQHLQPVQAVVDGVIAPHPRHFVGGSVIPVLDEVNDQGDEQKLEEYVCVTRPDIEDRDVVVVAGRAGQQANQQENVKLIDGRGRREVEDVGARHFLDVAPALFVGDIEFKKADQRQHGEIERVRDNAQRKGSAAFDAPPQNAEGEQQDRAIGVAADGGSDTTGFKSGLSSIDQLFTHTQSSTPSRLLRSRLGRAQRIGRPAERFTGSFGCNYCESARCPRVGERRPSKRGSKPQALLRSPCGDAFFPHRKRGVEMAQGSRA